MTLIDDAVPLELLQEIHSEMLKRISLQSPPLQNQARLELLSHLKQLSQLQTLSIMTDPPGQDPRCPDGTYPPCYGKGVEYYQRFLEVLRQDNARNLPTPA